MITVAKRHKFVLNVIGLRVLLDLSFIYAVSPLFTYAGLGLSLSPGKVIASYALTFLFGCLVPPTTSKTSDFLLLLLLVFVMLPCISLWSLQDLPTYHMALLSLGYGACITATYLRIPVPPVFRFGPAMFYTACLLLSGVVFLLLWQRGAAAYLNFNLRAVYEVRGDIAENVIYGTLGYLVPWYGKAIAPTLLAIALFKRRWAAALFVLLSEFLLFGLSSNKEYAFYPVVLLGIFALTGNVRSLNVRFVAISSLVVAAAVLAHSLTELSALITMIIHRSFYVVALNHFEYFKFFTDAPYVALSNSVLASFSEYPFDSPVPALIGYGRYGLGQEGFSNTGILASGYMHFGPLGVLFYGFYAGLMFRVFDALITNRIPLRLGLMAATSPSLQFVNADLSIALLTGGILLSFLLLLLLATPSAPSNIDKHRNLVASVG